jgi:thioredoxin-related protein
MDMDRRQLGWVIFGAVLLSIVWGAAGFARPSFGIRRLSGSRPKAPAAEPIQWHRDLRSAHRASQETGRPILIVVCGPGCAPCRRLTTETLGDESLATFINTEFIPVHLDYKKPEDQRSAEILEIKALPTCVILNSDAELLGAVEGFVRPPEFTKLLHQTLDYQQKLKAEQAASK